MNIPDPLSRRAWLQRISGPMLGASIGLGSAGPAVAHGDVATAGPLTSATGGEPVFNIRDFGAQGDGETLDTAAVQAAIDACTAAGGGIVLVPAGTFVIGTVGLKSHVTLHLAPQGRLLGSGDIAHYRAGDGIPPGNGNIVLLSAANADNVAITGPGTIDGNGTKFFTGRGDNTGPGADSSKGYYQRPHLLVFYRCRNLRLRDAFLTNSAYHGVRLLQCERVHIDGVRIHNRVNRNNDGFHFSSCRYVHLVNSDVKCQDDACALFGSNRFVTIANCSFSTRWSIFRFGGGECEDITVTNCLIYETYGCAIKMRAGARTRLENILFSNLVMKDVTGPVSIGLDSTSRRRPDDTRPHVPGIVRNIAFRGLRASVVATGRQHDDLTFESGFRPGETRTCFTLNAVGDEIMENISLSDVHVTYEGGGTPEEAAREVPAIAGEYFEMGTPPAYGLYARNVRGLTLQNVRIEKTQPDARPAVVFDHVTDAAVTGLSAQGDPQAGSLLRFADARDVLLTATRVLTPAPVLLRAEGAASAGITIDGGDLAKAATPVSLGAGVPSAAVRLRGVAPA